MGRYFNFFFEKFLLSNCTMYNLIFYVITLTSCVAIQMERQHVLAAQHNTGENCSYYTMTIEGDDDKIHIPDNVCLDYEIDLSVDAHCSGATYPIHCTWTLKRSTDATKIQSLVSLGTNIIDYYDSTSLLSKGSCGRRHMDCDKCGPWWFPYPCNCNCRGWHQVGHLCFQCL